MNSNWQFRFSNNLTTAACWIRQHFDQPLLVGFRKGVPAARRVRVGCNVHPTMEAFIVVEEHPYFVSPDHEGNYRFSDVPMGSYRISVWHPALGTRTEPFTLESNGEVLRLDIDLKK